MKKILHASFFLLFLFTTGFAQTQIWTRKGYAVGHTPGNETSNGSYIMPEVIKTGSGNYRMYYTIEAPDSTEIKYAESSDGVTWTVMGRILRGDTDTNARDFVIGGSSVVKLQSGQYRMYYRCRDKKTTPQPKYHMRSAISNDGINFTFEQIVMEIYAYDTTSYFDLVGQGTFYVANNGDFAAIFAGKKHGEPTGTPPDLYLGTSSDGLTWGNFKKLYDDWHDPIVLKNEGVFHLYATYLLSHQGLATSADGINWSTTMDNTVEFRDSLGNHLTEGSAGTGDIGGVVTYANKIRLYSNYGVPSVNLAYYDCDTTDLITSPGDSICSGKSYPLGASFGSGSYSWSPSTGLSSTTGASVVASPTITTTYSVTSGSDTKTIEVYVNNNPTITVSGSSYACGGSFTTLTAGGANSYNWAPSTGLNGVTSSVVNANPSTTTTYSITGADNNGCTSTSTFTVSPVPNPTVSVSAMDTICSGTTLTLSAGGATSYSWSAPVTLTSYTASITNCSPTSTTSFTVTGSDNNGCTHRVTKTVTVLNCSGINSYPYMDNLIIYPNPGKNIVTLEINNNDTKIRLIEIYNSIGERVYTESTINKKLVLDVSKFPSGIYILNISTEAHKQIKKIIIE